MDSRSEIGEIGVLTINFLPIPLQVSSAVLGQTRRRGNDARIAELYLVRRLTDQRGADRRVVDPAISARNYHPDSYPASRSTRLPPRQSIDTTTTHRKDGFQFVRHVTKLHEVGVFWGVFVVRTQNARSSKTELLKEQLRRQIGFSDF